MNGAHLHLILNHIPILGSFFAFVLLGYGMMFKNKSIAHAGLVTIVASALISIAVFLSGEEAEHAVENMIGVSQSAIEEHEQQAEIAYWIMLMSGAIALGTLLASLKNKIASTTLFWINLVAILLVLVLMLRVGYSGGEIHHPEIHSQ